MVDLRELIARAAYEKGSFLVQAYDPWLTWADAILAALDAAGLVVVPRRADEKMCRGMDGSVEGCLWQEVWASAIAASPFAKKEVG
jgi:hypothetical protein